MMRPAYVQRMARYNRWQNESLYGAADRLSDAERRSDRGAFFQSIHGTLSHILWADGIWMSRFEKSERPPGGIQESVLLYPDWDGLKDKSLEGNLSWFSGSAQRDITRPAWELVTHFFNHQTHHRGQVHAMLTQAGGKPYETDLWLTPE